jgi:hypothetical protein
VPGLAQAAQDLQRQLRQQGFELHHPNPRLLPREFQPIKLHADVSSLSPVKDSSAAGGDLELGVHAMTGSQVLFLALQDGFFVPRRLPSG